MAVESVSEYPQSFIAGDTLRVDLSNSDHPSDIWTLRVWLDGPSRKSFAAEEGDNGAFELVIPASDSAKLKPGTYGITHIFVDEDDERASVSVGTIQLLCDPAQSPSKSIARQTLEAMEAAFLKLASGTLSSVSFNGQGFTKKNLKELQDAITHQRAVVESEEAGLGGHRRIARILHPL